jgi:hypothetical protein
VFVPSVHQRIASADDDRQGGAPRYGWKAEGGELVPDPAEQAVVERIRTLRVDGASLRGIAEVLTAGGVPSNRGGRWYSQTVARVAG